MTDILSKTDMPGPGSPASVIAFDSHDDDSGAASVSYCYDVDKTWAENLANGIPQRCRDLPPADRCWAPEDKWIAFLNHKLASPLGVAAGPLLSSDWIGLAASRGYDCLTYKTIRSHYHPGHGLPNILHLKVNGQLPASGPSCSQPLFTATTITTSRNETTPSAGPHPQPHPQPQPQPALAITNSFGMPSQGPEEVEGDLRAAAGLLRPGQMMVVSVTGTPGRPGGLSFTEDLLQAARTALRGGATALEVNLSCPNVGSSHVALYRDAPAVEATVTALAQEVGGVPLVLKMGAFPSEQPDDMRRVLAAAARAGAGAVAGINGLSRRVELPGGGGPALGPDRPSSGVCGDPIRHAGLDFVRQARQVIAAGSLDLGVIGVGGVTQASHVMRYLQAGADVVQAATGFMWRPHLGTDFQRMWQAAGWELPLGDGRGGRG